MEHSWPNEQLILLEEGWLRYRFQPGDKLLIVGERL